MENTGKLTFAQQAMDWQFTRAYGEYIQDVVIDRIDKSILKGHKGRKYVKKYSDCFSQAKCMTAYQSFIIELDCVSLIGIEMERRGTDRHFPRIISYDLNGLSCEFSHTGHDLTQLDVEIQVCNVDHQVETILSILEAAGVSHLDMHLSGKNMTVSDDGILSLIDFDLAQAPVGPLCWSVERKAKLKTQSASRNNIMKIIKRNRMLVLE